MLRYALLGQRIKGSLSPELHRHAWAQNQDDADYELWSCRSDQFEVLVRRAQSELAGFNLTAPFKQKIIPYLDEQTPRAQNLGSVNVVRVQEGRLLGDNTDWHGVCASLDRLRDQIGPVLVLGAGGVLPSVIAGLRHFGFGPITIACRQPDDLAHRHSERFAVETVVPFDRRMDHLDGQNLVINATPLGADLEDDYPMRSARARGPVHWDLVYRSSGTTPWITAARAAGLFALDGRIMLIEQAIESQRFWGFDVLGAVSMRQLWPNE